MDLTDKQKAFCQEYIIDFNATQAAIRSGYSKNTARMIGHENLTKLYIQSEINRLIDERKERVQVKQDRIIYELAKIAFSDIGNHIDISNETGITIKDHENLDTSLLSEASETKKLTTNDKQGYDCTDIKLKIKLHDKLKALELLGKHLKIFTDKMELTGEIENNLTVEFINAKDTVSK